MRVYIPLKKSDSYTRVACSYTRIAPGANRKADEGLGNCIFVYSFFF